jgi:hypothetical protein
MHSAYRVGKRDQAGKREMMKGNFIKDRERKFELFY